MDTFELLKTLCLKEGISGDEKGFSEYARELLKVYCKNTWIDKLGNVYGHIPSGREDAKKLMIEAHLDRIGLMVKRIDENGFVEFSGIGGIDERILPSAEVTILGKENISGVIGAKPPHLRFEDDSDKIPKISDMLIDIGMTGEEAKEYIKAGDLILLKGEPCMLLNNMVASSALDNRAGMTAVFAFLEKTREVKLPYDLYVVFSAGEETGLVGASSAAYIIRPDIVAAVDVTFGKLHSNDKTPGTFLPGCGGVIFRGPDVSYEGTLNLIKKAKDNDIPFEIEVSGSGSGTDATVMQNSCGGAYSFLISIPIKYMHQTVEMVCIDDIWATGDLLWLIASGGVKFA